MVGVQREEWAVAGGEPDIAKGLTGWLRSLAFSCWQQTALREFEAQE